MCGTAYNLTAMHPAEDPFSHAEPATLTVRAALGARAGRGG
jgi:hypothetical protein